MKKTWTTPTLTTCGSVEQLTQAGVKDIVKIGKFLLPGRGFGLFASLLIP